MSGASNHLPEPYATRLRELCERHDLDEGWTLAAALHIATIGTDTIALARAFQERLGVSIETRARRERAHDISIH